MYFIYIDESGDFGQFTEGVSLNSPHFILSGIIVEQDNWAKTLDRLKEFRKHIKAKYGLLMREEIHAAELIRVSKTAAYKAIRKHDRIAILKEFLAQMPSIFAGAKIINIAIDKKGHPPGTHFAELAWARMVQRFDTFLKKNGNAKGIIIADSTDSDLIKALIRKMRVYNPVPSMFGGTRQIPADNILEDPFSRDSRHSYFIQAADCVAHALYRKEFPKGSLRKRGVEKFFELVAPLLLKEAARSDEFGVVRK